MNWTLFVLTEWWLCDLIYDVIHTQHIHAPVLATFWTGCPLSRRKNSLSFPCFSRAIIILSSQQEVYVIMAFVYQGSFHVNYYSCTVYSTSTTTTHMTNNSLSSHIAQINSFCGYIWTAWHRLHPEHKVSFPWGGREFHEFSMFREIPEHSRFSSFVATLLNYWL